MRIALVDSDEIAYKIALQYQQQWYLVKKDDKTLWRYKYKEEAIESIGNRDDLEIESFIEPLELVGYKDKIDMIHSRILCDTNSSDIRLYLSGEDNFRYKMATLLPYKGDRVKANRPVHLDDVKKFLRDERGATSLPHLEADDLLSSGTLIYEDCVICSQDKDLRTVPSWNYNTQTHFLQLISEDTARYNFYLQLLIGDSTDNIPSPYMLGEVGAAKIIDPLFGSSEDNYYQASSEAYSKFLFSKDKSGNYKTKWYTNTNLSVHEVLYEVGNLLWMRRTLDPNERWTTPVSYIRRKGELNV